MPEARQEEIIHAQRVMEELYNPDDPVNPVKKTLTSSTEEAEKTEELLTGLTGFTGCFPGVPEARQERTNHAQRLIDEGFIIQ
ncbi:MAG: hypothetical protein U5L00_03640 [Desulfovermiculus sp.]|nr:hypothetical protein [Desulfovermiculus sp.]